MPDNTGNEGDGKPVTMDDLEKVQAAFKSSMEAQMEEVRNMFLELRRDHADSLSPRI